MRGEGRLAHTKMTSMRTRIFKQLVEALVILALWASQSAAWADADTSIPVRMARGWIVKLKDGTPAVSLLRLRANQLPVDSAVLNSGLASVARQLPERSRDYKRTAFAAHLFGRKHLMTLAQAEAQAAILRRNPNVEWVIANEVMHAASASTLWGASVNVNGPGYSSQTWLQPRDASHAAVANFPAAWQLVENQALTPVVVAVLDTGILPAPNLAGRVLPGYDFVSELEFSNDGTGMDNDPTDPGDWLTQQDKDANPALYGDCDVHNSSWHGLGTSSMLAMVNGNNQDGVGILAPLPGAVLLPVRVSGICGASVSDMIEGMLWAAGVGYHGSPALNPNPARVINISFGGDGSCDAQAVGSVGWLYRQTVDQLRSMGALVVASAGNGDANSGIGLATLTRPANCPGVLAVTGLNLNGYKAVYGNLVDPGKDYAVAVATGDGTFNGSSWSLSDGGIAVLGNTGQTVADSAGYALSPMLGTSFGAPTAAGVAALMLAVNPNLTADQVMQAISTRTAPFPDSTAVGRAVCTGPGTPSGCLPVCDGSNISSRGNCYCTTTNCGGGLLDAEKAVQWAINQIGNPNATSYQFAYANVSYFTPDRLRPATQTNTTSSGGGGGGAVDSEGLLALLLALIVLVAIRIKGGRR